MEIYRPILKRVAYIGSKKGTFHIAGLGCSPKLSLLGRRSRDLPLGLQNPQLLGKGMQAEAVLGSGSQGSLASQSPNLFQLCLLPPSIPPHPQLLQKTTVNLSVLPAAKSSLSKQSGGGQPGSIPSTSGWVHAGLVPNPRTRTWVKPGVTGVCCSGRVPLRVK